ncbi:MAG TPA: proline--tRNA ligase, partial [bacterium]|nr:proline--tRNA ligase [bacterium]
QKNLFDRAKEFRDKNTIFVSDYAGLKKIVENEEGFARCFWAGSREDEAKIKEETKATIRCIPMEQSGEKGRCVLTGKETNVQVIFAKAY